MSRTLVRTGAAVAACVAVGSIASREIDSPWYRALRKPALQPPPVATVLSGALWRANRG